MTASGAVGSALSLVGERTEQALMQRLAEVASELGGSWGAVTVLLGADGTPSVIAQHGLSRDQVGSMRLLPQPDGLLARVLEGTTVQLAHWTEILGPHEPRTDESREIASAIGSSVGPFLGVPILRTGEVLGAVYLGRAPDAPVYADDEIATVELLADAASRLVTDLRHKNATDLLIDRLGRGDTARRTDDVRGMNGSFTIRRLLASARRVLGSDVAYLAQVTPETELIVYTDAAADTTLACEGDLRPRSDTYCGLLIDGTIPASVPDLLQHPITGPMQVTADLGARSYCGTVVRLPDGAVFGTLCGLSRSHVEDVSATQIDSLRVLAELIGIELGQAQEREAENDRQLAAFRCSTQPSRRSIYLQPIVDLDNGRTVGFEALSRFTDSLGNHRRPDLVFEEASALGLGVALEQDVAADALRLLPMVPADCYLSVNLSPQALTAPATFSLLTSAVEHHAGRVVVELTEHEQVSDYPALLDTLASIRSRGLRLAIDDTGAGYASLQHVTRMRPEIVKLDMTFVRDVHLDPGRRAVARALTAFAADVGANLIAEGIEYAEEADELIRIGARYGQGYLYGRPLPAAEAVAAALGTLARSG